MKLLNQVNRWVHNLSGVLLGVMTSLVIAQVFFRYVLSKPLIGSEELARFAMVWLVMIGATVVLRNRSHIAVEFFVELCPKAVQKAARILTYLLILVFSWILLTEGIHLTESSMNHLAPATQIPNGYITLSIPIAGFISILYMLEAIVLEFKGKDPTSNEEAVEK
ncbi:TRAP transporter small permease [Mesobacillus harenae]|uniref:TRAP transporter small permease n=1 Tax=Mesobacillus harenae TaxID=2213203 RepID=UPI00158031A0|nr:TRAP transporter small permease [Mesobacillus harenae]